MAQGIRAARTGQGDRRPFLHKGKWIDVGNKWYQLYVHVWTDLFFIRRPIFYLRDRMKAVYRRMRKKHKNTDTAVEK